VVELTVDEPHTDAIDGKRKGKNKAGRAAPSLPRVFSEGSSVPMENFLQ
jgi:hypothetical protein